MSSNLLGPNSTYVGSNASSSTLPFIELFEGRSPTTSDINYPVQKRWFNTTTNNEYLLIGYTSSAGVLSADWRATSINNPLIEFAAGPNTAGSFPVQPSGLGDVTIGSTGGTVIITGGLNSLNFEVTGSGATVDEFITNISGPVIPDMNNDVFVNASTSTYTDGTTANTLKTEVQATNHGVVIGKGALTPISVVGPTVTAGQVLQSAGAAADPAFSTATYPATTTINQILYSSSANIVSGLPTANRAVFTTTAAGVPQATALALDGQLIIGSTAGAPAAATLTAGTGITITNASNGITIAANGSVIGETITGQSGGALSPTAGNWNIYGGTSVPGTSPVVTSGSGSTLTTNVQRSQAIAAADTTKVGLSNFDSASFAVDANGFVTLLGPGAGLTLTGNSGGALSPTANNFNVLGTGSITIAGSGSTLTTQLTGMTNHYLPIGAGNATLTMLAPSATSGVPLISQGSSADPAYGTAVVAGGGTGNTTFTAYSVICAGTTATGAFQNVSGVGTAAQVLTSNGAGALPTWQAASGGGGLVQQKRATSTTATSTTKTLNDTGTSPTTSNTDSIITLSVTPTNASNILMFEFCTPYSCNTDGMVSFCLFEGSTFRTGFPQWQNGNTTARDETMNFTYYRTAGTTSPTTFDVRWGTSAGTCRTLQNGSGTAFYNGSGNSAITLLISEYTP